MYTALPETTATIPYLSSSWIVHTLDLATGVFRSRIQEFGTVYPPHCGSLTLNFDTLNDLKAFLFGETVAH